MKEADGKVKLFRKKRTDDAPDPKKQTVGTEETELVLKLKKDELFDPYVLSPHSELNSIVYNCVDVFVDKFGGNELTLSIYTDPVSPMVQEVFREVYYEHYLDELRKVNRFLKRHYYRVLVLLLVSVLTFVISSQLTRFNPDETIISYVIANVSCFCLWEVGYTQFDTLDEADEKKRITRAMNAKIEFL